MFFYTRYPSSNMLKMFFSDVKFNRCITSQLIKWFSNFREFYYIQMEKFARQAINDGVTGTEELNVTRDCELYRALNMHYNKANDFEVGLCLVCNVEGICLVAENKYILLYNGTKIQSPKYCISSVNFNDLQVTD
ncbi:prospero homeobox protein 1-like [Acipenser ruthenus]|nr:prospero homeobox protein 1-like [Acipenser ruthenus]